MKLISNIKRILNKPFPEEENFVEQLKTISFVSLFIFLFLIIFQPFGISDGEGDKYWVCLGFGITTFIAMLIYVLLFNLAVKLKGTRKQWTYWKWIVYNTLIILPISLANFLFARFWIFGYIEWGLYPQMMYSTLMIGIIPVTFLGWVSLIRQERKYRQISADINSYRTKKSESEVATSSSKNIFGILVDQIRYVESLQNYVNITYIDSKGNLSKKTERSTLKKVIEQLQDTPIIKCHRSYLVNKNEITSTTGNAQGLILTLNNCVEEVPVSRSFVAKFRK